MKIEIRPLPFKPPRLQGLSERLIASHYINNYGGAVQRFNAITSTLASGQPGDFSNFQWNGYKREELIALNSVVLHEIYFNGLGGDGSLGSSVAEAWLKEKLAEAFGSFDDWREQFTTMAKSLAGGSGWVVLSWSNRLGRLINQWACDHAHVYVDATPLFALDMYEHAYHLDFGANASAYVDALMANLHWARIAEYLRPDLRAEQQDDLAWISPGELMIRKAQAVPIEILDVRLSEDLALANDMVIGARWYDPSQVVKWASNLPRDRELVVHCLYGFDVGKNCARQLASLGFQVKILRGGIVAWQAAGGPMQPKQIGLSQNSGINSVKEMH